MMSILREKLGLNSNYAGRFLSDFELYLGMAGLYAIGGVIGSIFYNHVLASIIMGFVMQVFLTEYVQYKLKKINIRIIDEFMIFNSILLGEISGSASIENIYRRIGKNVKEDKVIGISLLKKEFEKWSNAVNLGERPENVLMNFAKEFGDMSILQYSFVFKISRKQGVDLKTVISTINQILREKIRINQDINVLISEKKLEQKIMNVMPFVMILFLKYTAFEFISPLYENVVGRVAMSIVLIIFGICYIWSNKITNIV